MDQYVRVFERILVANRGEIALRIIKTCQKMAIETVAVYSDADQGAPFVKAATESVHLGRDIAKETYLNGDLILKIAKEKKVKAIHPGYGFLSESYEFAKKCEEEGIVFIGPSCEVIRSFSHKEKARAIAQSLDIPILPGSSNLKTLEEAHAYAEKAGFPLLLKCSSGGGGIGMMVCRNQQELAQSFATAQKTGQSYFSSGDVFLERFVQNPRHIEVQIFGDGLGNYKVLGERECSIQRRHQKIIEETPSPFVDEDMRTSMYQAADNLARHLNYHSAGTVEFIVDQDERKFYFLEVNTRLQVEHTVTEEVLQVDLVAWMIQQAEGQLDLRNFRLSPKGHAMQVRVHAEDPAKDFLPSPGCLTNVSFPQYQWARFDCGVETGFHVPSVYDPLLAKIIVWGENRD